MPLAKDVNLRALAKKTKDYSGADIAALCREAGLQAYRKKKGKSKKILSEKDIASLTVTKEDFNSAFETITPWAKKF
jgi:transitional endoplasmic reticulum ATPase